MADVDVGFVLAIVTLGWGLSLATYRVFAKLFGWPMGDWHRQRPGLPVAIGVLATLVAAFFAVARGWGGHVLSAWAIPLFGIAWAVFWTGFLRIGAQSALLLAPAAALWLMVWWLS